MWPWLELDRKLDSPGLKSDIAARFCPLNLEISGDHRTQEKAEEQDSGRSLSG